SDHVLPAVDSRPPPPTPFPYTTLFRSPSAYPGARRHAPPADQCQRRAHPRPAAGRHPFRAPVATARRQPLADAVCPKENAQRVRSEEHTSELQSRENLVCRLLLEKKRT